MNITLREGRENRRKAQELGEKTYENRACKTCGSTTRYTKSSACVQCSIARAIGRYESLNYNQVQWRANRRAAKFQGLMTYHGKVCETCNSSVRYTSNKACVECHKSNAKVRRSRKAPEDRNSWAKENRIKAMLCGCRARAKAKGLEFTLTEADIVIPTHCPALGLELSWDGEKDVSPSVDRLDSTKGYTPENIRVISTRANRLKSDATLGELEALTSWMRREFSLLQ